ncbi:hypothetical protein JCM9279_004956 [Rhodotorula babjevae]
MAFCSATLCYDITVKAVDLCIAGMAFAEIKATLLAIDLVLSRKAAGTLATSVLPGTVDVGALPVEIWDIVKLKLCALSYVREYGRLELRYHPCLSTDEYWDEEERERAEEPLTFEHLLGTDRAWDKFFLNEGVPDFADKHAEAVATLLEYFGLCMPSPTLFSKTKEDLDWDLTAAWAVTIPLISDRCKVYPTIKMDVALDDGPFSALSRISPAALVPPADALARFHRLLASFPAVSPISQASDTIRAPTEGVPPPVKAEETLVWAQLSQLEKQRVLERARARERVERKEASEPGWMLCGRSSSWD